MVGVIMIVFAAIRYNCGFIEKSISNNRPNSGKAKTEVMLTAELKRELNSQKRREHRGEVIDMTMRCSDTLVKTGDNKYWIIFSNVTLHSNVHRITHQIRGKLKREIVMPIAELTQRLKLVNCGETRWCGSLAGSVV
jgi:hypothetical protein